MSHSNEQNESPAEYAKKKLTPYRVTKEDLKKIVKSVDFHVFPGTNLTVCCMTTENGFTVTGEAACVDPENFDAKVGKCIAYDKAFDKLWALEGYLMKENFFRGRNPEHEALHRDSRHD